MVDGPRNPRTGAWFGTKPAEVLLVFKAPGANTLDVVDRIQAMMPQLEKSVPRSVHVDLVSDRSLSIRSSVSDVEFTLVLALALVVMVIFLFLRKFWATVIPSITLPVVIVATFAGMYLLNYSIDNLSLMALTISIGFLVDDAIVMIENIVRHIEAGKPPLEAALDGAGEIGFTILSITLSLAAVFIPVLFMAGVVGLLFHEFAMTTVLAIFLSGFVSLTLTPMMCARFLTPERHERQGRFSRWLENGFDRMRDLYDRGLIWTFAHQFPMLMVNIGLIVLTVVLYIVIPKGFLPEQDTGIFIGVAQAREDTAFKTIAAIENECAAIILKDPAVSGIVGFAGATGGNPSESTSRMFAQLKPFDQRPSVHQVIARLKPALAKVVGVKFYMQSVPDIRIGARLEQAEYQYTLTDTSTDELNRFAPMLLEKLQGMQVLTDVASDQQIHSPHVVVEVDRNLASTLNVPVANVDAALQNAFGQAQIANIYLPTQQAYLILEVERKFQSGPQALSSIYVTNTSGGQVPLSAVTHVTRKVEPLTINHQGVFPAVTLSFNLAKGASLSQAVDAITAAKASLGAAPTLVGQFEGTAQAFQSSLVTMPLLVMAAILVIYILMGMLYESFIHPITILSALPAAGVGALLILLAMSYRSHPDCAHRHPAPDRHRQEECDHDDRLRARRRTGARDEPGRCGSSGLPAALPPDHDDDGLRADRGASPRRRNRRGRRAATPNGDCHRRRPDRLSVDHALYDAGGLSVPRPPERLAEPPPTAVLAAHPPPGAWSLTQSARFPAVREQEPALSGRGTGNFALAAYMSAQRAAPTMNSPRRRPRTAKARGIPPPPAVRRGQRHRFANPPSRSGDGFPRRRLQRRNPTPVFPPRRALMLRSHGFARHKRWRWPVRRGQC